MALPTRNLEAGPGSRHARRDNRYGLQGIDRCSLPTLDVDGLCRFVAEVLGGELYAASGCDEADRALGLPRQVVMRVGRVLLQLAEPADGRLVCGRVDANAWPHWAFAVSAADLERNVERLRSLGIPVFGPVTHAGEFSAAAYFASPEGHKLELKTYDLYPADKLAGEMGAPGVGYTDWPALRHDWPRTGR